MATELSSLLTEWKQKIFIVSASCSPTIWIISILTSLIILFLINMQLQQQHRKSRPPNGQLPLPPGPRSWPIVGSLLQARAGSLPHHWFAQLGNQYGPLIHLNMGSLSFVVANNAKMAKEVLASQDADFAFRPHNTFSDHVSMGYEDIIFRHADPKWRHLRKICASSLFTVSAMKMSAEVRRQEIHEMVRSLSNSAAAGSIVNLRRVVYDNNLNSGSRLLYGKKWFTSEHSTNPDVIACLKSMHEVVAQSSKTNIGDLFPALRWLDLQGYERMLQKEIISLKQFQIARIAEHRQKMQQSQTDLNDENEKDLIDVMLSLKGEESLSESAMSGVLIDLVLGATDTTTLTIEWALTELLAYPEMLHKAQEEIDSVVGKERLLQETDLINLPYLQAIVKETLRLHPALPLGLPHHNPVVAHVAGYTIPAASIVLINLWAIGRDPHAWPNPDEFNPERFLGSDIQPLGQHFQFIPFSAGRRKCPGYPLALAQVPYVLAALLQAFDLRLPAGQSISEGSIMKEIKGSLASYKKAPLEAVVSCRLPAAICR